MSIRRLLRFLAVGASALALATSVPADAFNGTITPGHLTGSFSFAQGGGFDPNTFVNASFEVQTGTSYFRPHKPEAPLIAVNTDSLLINVDTPGGFGFGCWLIPTQDFVVHADLSATLTFDSSDPLVSPCPGDPVANPVSGATSQPGPVGFSVGLSGNMTASVTWTTASPVTETRSTVKETCQPFQSLGQGVSDNVQSSLAGTLTGTVISFDGITPIPISLQFQGGVGNVNTSSNKTNITGPSSGACGPFGSP